MKNPPSGSVVHLKHRLSKREYKVVLSKTYVGTILLMHMYQGKGRWGSLAEVSALTWLVLNYEYQTCGKKRTRVHYNSSSNTPLWILPRLSHEKARHSTHTYLGKFYKYPVQVV